MSDYFGALALRTLRPELGVQPRRSSPFADAVPRRSDDVFAVDDEAVAFAARPGDVSVGNERAPRSRRRITAPAGGPVDEAFVPSPVAFSGTRSRAIDAGSHVIAVPAARSAVRATDSTTILRTETLNVTRARYSVAEPPEDDRRAPDPLTPRPAGRSDNTLQPSLARVKEAPPSEPTVRIHIGRVDVRAVAVGAPTAPPRQESTPAGLMTLDEYVKQRDGASS